MKNVEIYTGPLCAFCDFAKALLDRKGISYKEIFIGDDANKMEEMIKKSNGMRTVHQILIVGQQMGVNDNLHALERDGKLNSILGI